MKISVGGVLSIEASPADVTDSLGVSRKAQPEYSRVMWMVLMKPQSSATSVETTVWEWRHPARMACSHQKVVNPESVLSSKLWNPGNPEDLGIAHLR